MAKYWTTNLDTWALWMESKLLVISFGKINTKILFNRKFENWLYAFLIVRVRSSHGGTAPRLRGMIFYCNMLNSKGLKIEISLLQLKCGFQFNFSDAIKKNINISHSHSISLWHWQKERERERTREIDRERKRERERERKRERESVKQKELRARLKPLNCKMVKCYELKEHNALYKNMCTT